MRTIAVTGSASRIGAATARPLHEAGHRTIGIDLHGDFARIRVVRPAWG